MSNSFSGGQSLNNLLLDSLQGIQSIVEEQNSSSIKPGALKSETIKNLVSNLSETRSELNTRLDAEATVIDLKLLDDLDSQINNALNSQAYGSILWTELRHFQQLVKIARSLKRGERAEAIDTDMDQKDDR